MCAINGLINWVEISNSDASKIEKSLLEMNYRGPDYSNFQVYSNCILGHNRLSILDLNTRSNQPMNSVDKRYSIVFNGEIYNFQEIKCELQNLGINFISTSDTEVLLQGFIKFGQEIVEKLRGMFAFAIWDNETKELFVARDRFGEKPFYFIHEPHKYFAFASNLAGIVELTNHKLEISKQAIFELLSQQSIDVDSCIYHGIHKLQPGYLMKINANDINKKKYWTLDYSNKIESTFKESKEKIHQLLIDSVHEQLIADVPVGLFLSGGVDSSVIASIASKNKSDITAITMSTPENKNFDEAESASYVAKKLKINHTIVILDDNCVNDLPKILKTIEPLADASLIPTMAIANEAQKDFKVMLSGDGGDEIFGGYKLPVKYNETKFTGNFFTKFIVGNILKSSNSFLSKKLNDKRILKYAGLETYFENSILNLNEAKILLKSNQLFENKNSKYFNESNYFTTQDADKFLYVGVKNKLVNDFLHKMDSANMFYSVESRAPFLDHRIIDFTSQLSINQLMPNGIDKQILKSIGSEYLPKPFFESPKKGFSIPYYDYLKTTWNDLLIKLVSENISEDLDLINKKYVLELIINYRIKPTFAIGKVLYSILVFEIWLRVFHLKQNPKTINLN
ncbi:asparagine synthase (glutamine-hydrolyzing) [Flavobacterium sp.]|uniref:asparagine synthase (glutamine-hydrolyzing) n=1 Tax=Flavobacterium sp. TaxID=239 RepID=UPI00286CAE0D|nr:asparagine synthase (glutamine-hydrolyzing) [Flavobacterium sp.]